MKPRLLRCIIALNFLAYALHGQTAADTIIYAQGNIVNAATKEPVNARIMYESLPYGNRVGVINNSTFSFPMYDGERYSIIVEADGYASVKYMLDPAQANAERKVVKNIELGKGANPPEHKIGEVLRINNLIFEAGKSKIDPESYPALDVVLNMMNQNPRMVIQLEGHTDVVGDPKDNLRLSQDRVEAVRTYLAQQGLQRSRIKTKAFGGASPISRDNTPEAHRLNRRVEVRILQN